MAASIPYAWVYIDKANPNAPPSEDAFAVGDYPGPGWVALYLEPVWDDQTTEAVVRTIVKADGPARNNPAVEARVRDLMDDAVSEIDKIRKIVDPASEMARVP